MTIVTPIQKVLDEQFGWSEFKTGQEDVITRLVNGKSSLAVFPTGGGKSLCYQLPALMFEGITLVVSPLIALMKDQIDQLESRGIQAVRLESNLSFDEYREATNKIRRGEARILYVAPERFFNERFRGELEGLDISLFAIDEAHCISQWGHNFRPDYLKLAGIAKELNVERILCLTATATPAVQDDICNAFDIQKENVICTSFFRPNLHLRTQLLTKENRDEALIANLKNSLPGAAIVYVTLQKTAEQVADLCRGAGLETRHYHAGMDAESRTEVQDWFMQSQSGIVVATIAFGMGIDKADIRYVYHYNPPKSMESYAQEIGRAGRDGNKSICQSLLVPEDRIVVENFVFGDTPSLPSIRKMVETIANQDAEFFVSQIKLSNLCDIRSIVTKTMLTYLELDGYLQSTAPRYESYRFKPNVSGQELINHFEGERKDFVQRVLACSTRKKTWCEIDVEAASQKLCCDRIRIVKAFNYFSEQGWIELKASGLVFGYRKQKSIDSIDQLAQHYFEKVSERETNEIARTRRFFDFAKANECQAAMLSAHFGQVIDETCGNCSHCMGEGNLQIPEPQDATLSEETLGNIQQLVNEHPVALNTPRAIARLMCGTTSPALTRARLTRHPVFGSAENVPFDAVMRQVEGAIDFSIEPVF